MYMDRFQFYLYNTRKHCWILVHNVLNIHLYSILCFLITVLLLSGFMQRLKSGDMLFLLLVTGQVSSCGSISFRIYIDNT